VSWIHISLVLDLSGDPPLKDPTMVLEYGVSLRKGHTHERNIFGNSSVSLSLTLSKIVKVEHHIRMKTHKSTALTFWVKSCVNPLCGLGSYLIGCERLWSK